MQLAASPQWRALLHYEPRWLSSRSGSIVTSQWFFLAENGAEDAAAELEATLERLLQDRPLQPWGKPARCAFPARAAFLRESLGLPAGAFQTADCDGLQSWRERLAATSASLVFPTAYLNSPASMFGHTLLRLDSKRGEGSSELLAFAVNFAARTGENTGIEFAYRGLAGGYMGSFGVYPYYEKVKQYSWIENRDIWSYPLQLSPTELDRLENHLWELRDVEFDYYFLSKNCSYQLLALLQAVRPGLELTPRFRVHAIPGETIRALAAADDLLGAPRFRPSLRSRLAQRLEELPESEQDWVRRLGDDPAALESPEFTHLDQTVRARLLELAHDDLYYRQQTSAVAEAPAEARMSALLLARSRIRQSLAWPADRPPAGDPAQGHAAFRVAAGPHWSDEAFSLALELRPSYHDLLDPPAGFVPGASLGFLDARLLATPDRSRVRLDYLALVDIESLAARSRLFKPVSWSVRGGLRRPGHAGADNPLGGFLEGGPGLAWRVPVQTLLHAQALGSVDYSNGFTSGYALGGGARVGLLRPMTHRWRIRAEAGAVDYLAGGNNGYQAWLRLEQQLDLLPGLALRARAERVFDHEGQGHAFSLLLQRYF